MFITDHVHNIDLLWRLLWTCLLWTWSISNSLLWAGLF